MFYYHESELDEFHLDKKPLLHDAKSNNFYRNEITPVYDNECYVKNLKITDYTINTESIEIIMDENENCIVTASEDVGDNICGCFVAAFDTKRGNIIEWQIPDNLNLEHVEFKAIASGFHLMKSDLV